MLAIPLLTIVLTHAVPSAKCSLQEFRHWTPTRDDLVARTTRIVDSAAVIVLVRAIGYEESQRGTSDGLMVRFEVIERLRGDDSGSRISVPGRLVENDDYNHGSVPYTNVRPAGNRGSCFAEEYRSGAQYLLLLRDGTPYWRALAPVNEQVRGRRDPWVAWVRRHLGPAR